MCVMAVVVRCSLMPERKKIARKSFEDIIRERLKVSKEVVKIKFIWGDFRGKELWEPILETAEEEKALLIVKLCKEDLLIDPSLVDQMIRLQKEKKFDFIAPSGFPKGIAPEILTLDALKRSINLPHKTPKAYPRRFKIHLFEPLEGYLQCFELNLRADTEESFELIEKIYSRLYKDGEIVNVKEAIKLIHEEKLSMSPFNDYYFEKEPAKALIIRSARMWQVNSLIRALKGKFPNIQISILAQPSVIDELRFNPLVKEVILYDKGKYFKPRLRSLREIWKRRFDLIIIPYNNPFGKGYLQVELIAAFSKIKEKVIYDSEGNVYNLNFWRWFDTLPKRSQVIRFLRAITKPITPIFSIVSFFCFLAILKIYDFIWTLEKFFKRYASFRKRYNER